jgi:hypothetical protein
MSVLLVGSAGNMGTRYQAVLKYLQVPFRGIDIYNKNKLHDFAKESKHIIIATPTVNHIDMIKELTPYQLPILCEKPITKSPERFYELDFAKLRLNMVCNYEYMDFHMPPAFRDQLTYYDFYKSGDDGLIWDCIQLFKLKSGPVYLNNKSPVWKVYINGAKVSRSSVDVSYIKMCKHFLMGNIKTCAEDLFDLHCKVKKVADGYAKSYKSEYWDTSTDDERAISPEDIEAYRANQYAGSCNP